MTGIARRCSKIFFGDNLEILLRYTEDRSVDLFHPDLAFKSNADCKILLPEKDGMRSAPHLRGFDLGESAIWW